MVLLHLALAICQSSTAPEFPAKQNLCRVAYQRQVVSVGPGREVARNSIVGWSLSESDLPKLASALSDVLSAPVSITGGKLQINVDGATYKKLIRQEQAALWTGLTDAIKARNKVVNTYKEGSLADRINACVEAKRPGPNGGNISMDCVYFLPANDLSAKVITALGDGPLAELATETKLFLTDQNLLGAHPLGRTFPVEVQTFAEQSNALYAAAKSGALSQDAMSALGILLPSIELTPEKLRTTVSYRRAFGQTTAWATASNPDGSVAQGGSYSCGYQDGPTALPLNYDPSKKDVGVCRFSEEAVGHHRCGAHNYGETGSDFMDYDAPLADDPTPALIDPAVRDPLSFEVQEALDALAKYKGAHGWVANCPDVVYSILVRCMRNEVLDLEAFDKLLAADGECVATVRDGIMEFFPTRPLNCKFFRLDRDSLQRVVKSSKGKKAVNLSAFCEYMLANNIIEGQGLTNYFWRAINWRSGYAGAGLVGNMSIVYQVLATIHEPYRSQIADGEHIFVPGSEIDWEKMLDLSGMIYYATSGFNPANIFTIKDTPNWYLMPQPGVSPGAECWTEPGTLVLKRARLEDREYDRSRPSSRGTVTKHVVEKAGTAVDTDWMPPEKLGLVPPTYAPVMPNASMLQTGYRYLIGKMTTINMRFRFPSGQISLPFPIVKVEQVGKSVTFDQLDPEIQQRILSNAKI